MEGLTKNLLVYWDFVYSRQIGPPEGAEVVIILNDHAIFKLIHGKQTEKNRQTDKDRTNRQTDKQKNREKQVLSRFHDC
jgi:hypothetical protein